jgi:hypothetical protein
MIVPDLIKAVESGWEKSRLEGLKIQGKHRMNERIREVWIKAAREDSDPDNWDTQEQFIERFAELIVTECMNQVREQYLPVLEDEIMMKDTYWDGYVLCGVDSYVAIKEHFGVEE